MLCVVSFADGGASEMSDGIGCVELPYVVLAWDGTRQFGPKTDGTRTAGWQEALDFCVERKQDLYVKGGWGGRDAIYHVQETIEMPPTQDFRIDGGEYVMNWTGASDKDMLIVDSGMDCHYTFGILVYGGTRAALRVQPENPVPIDGFAVFIDSEISASSIADPHPFRRGKRAGGSGVVFDTQHAGILHSNFAFTAVLNFATCIVTPDSGGGFAYNRLECGHLHTNADSSTLIDVGGRSDQNTISVRIGVDQGAVGVRGVDVSGDNNVLDITTRGGGFAPGCQLVFEGAAQGNRADLILRAGDGVDLAELVTDVARVPTNRVAWTGAPAPFSTVMIDPVEGVAIYVQRLFPAVIRITDGQATEAELVRGLETVSVDCDRDIFMGTGDELKVRCSAASKLRIMPFDAK